jgi:flagellar motor switch protein FliN/FliY
MSNDAPLLRLGGSTADAIEGLLKTFAPDGIRRGAVSVRTSADDAAAGLVLPAVAADVSYVDGVTGGNLFMLPVEGARRLAAAMMGQDPDSVETGGELSELELSAVGEAMNQMMSAAAMATSDVLGQEVEIAPPQIRTVETEAEAIELLGGNGSAHILTADVTVLAAPSRLIQLVPNAFVVKMTRALDELTQEYTSAPLSDSLRGVPVRVWAELGRARMAAGASLGVATGSVVELDREVDEPIDLYVDGMRFATGRLLVAEDGSLQLQVESVIGLQTDTPPADQPLEPQPIVTEPEAPVAVVSEEEPVAAPAEDPEPAPAASDPEPEPEPATESMEV